MRIGWLQDDPGYVGGAELTMRDLAAAAPDGVELVDCPPGKISLGLDRYVVGNCMFYLPGALPRTSKIIRFVHDERGPGPIDSDHRVFYSPLQRDHLGLAGELCPAPLDRRVFCSNGNQRLGSIHIGTFGHHGKGQVGLAEWARRHGPLAVYGHGPFPPSGPGIEFRGSLAQEQVADVLQHAERFVHLPTVIEGYGRSVAEAYACGCELVDNKNIGCLYWLKEDESALDTAAERFWEYTLNV